ncbi:OTU domain-containing protein [Pseudomonas sp. OA65]|uniref:OTU domain-containing protein n=1 Tax=Pseudomonas sp. OA65 TaxID=2818431 RepID=UPI001FB0E170|nr:OTU domain-containing protein [Pseudomonas sp. OA65]
MAVVSENTLGPSTVELEKGGELSTPEQYQLKQLALLDSNQVALSRLFARVPTFDVVVENFLIDTIKSKIAASRFRAPLFETIEPDSCYVNHYTADGNGARTLTSSQRFSDVLWNCLLTDTPPSYTQGGVGFFTRSDSVEEAHSLFAKPVDEQILRIMESTFYIANPTTNPRLQQHFLDELKRFRNDKNVSDPLGTSTSSTVEATFAHLLSQRFQHFFDLYKADRDSVPLPTQEARIQQGEEYRLLDIITTHPSMADRNRLLRKPVPQVYAVMLDRENAAPRKWPAAMVIKSAQSRVLFLYSLEGGIQRFHRFEDLVASVHPLHEGQQCNIRDMASEVSGNVFEVAAADLLGVQRTALEQELNAPENEKAALKDFAKTVEDALGLPVLSLAGPLAVRQRTVNENNRADFYKNASRSQQAHYRRLEEQVFQAVYKLGSGVETLIQFTRQKIKQYLQQRIHPGIDPDPDKTMVTLTFGSKANPRQSRVVSLTQLMLDNIRPHQYPNAMREVLTVYLADKHGQRIPHPVSGFLITLTGRDLAGMATTIDAGGNYETLLREKMNKPDYKNAWRAAYLANLKFKGYEAELQGNAVFKATVTDRSFDPPRVQKLVACWLDAVLQSPATVTRTLVGGQKVHVHGLLLGGSVGAGGQHGSMGNAISIEGPLIFSSQDGPDIKGTVGVYFPDSPDGDDFHEFADLSDGIAQLLVQKEWQDYFRARIATIKPEEIAQALGQRSRPLIRGALLTGDLFDVLHRAHVNFHSAYADHRSNSNLEIRHQSYARALTVATEIMMDLAGLLIPGLRLFSWYVRAGLFVHRTGALPLDFKTLVSIFKVTKIGAKASARQATVPVRGQSTYLVSPARQSQEVLTGLPLEESVYSRYVVTDTSVIRGVAQDAQGFYRATIVNGSNGGVTRPIYIRQPDGTVFRVHDHTRLAATEAIIVDPATGSNIRSSGVMRNTVARMPNGEWRAVGFGRGGGKRPGSTSPKPGPSQPKKPAVSDFVLSEQIRRPGTWNNDIMDLVPPLVTRLPNWPQNRSLLIIDEIAPDHHWSVRFTPGQAETIYPSGLHPNRASTDIVLRRRDQNHYDLLLGSSVRPFAGDGDCFFNAVVAGLNEGQTAQAFSMQGLRNSVATYIEQNPELNQFLAPQPTGLQQALFENANWLEHILDDSAVLYLTRIAYGAPNPYGLFLPTVDFLNLHAESSVRDLLHNAPGGDLPPEIMQHIGRNLTSRSPVQLTPTSTPFYEDEHAMRTFFEDVLLKPIVEEHIVELLNNEYLWLSQDVMHVMLEYGVTARQLTDHHPRNDLAYVQYDEALHGHLDDDQLDEVLDGASLVDRDDLEGIKQRYQREFGTVLEDEEDLFEQFIAYDRAEEIIDLYSVALERYPTLLDRANIVLRSMVISSTLGNEFPLSAISSWIRTPALSDEHLRLIALYADSRAEEILRGEGLDIGWMQRFDVTNLQHMVSRIDTLNSFIEFLDRGRVNANELALVNLFSIKGSLPSNSRVTLLLNRPNLWTDLQKLSQAQARQVWHDLVGPHYTDLTIRLALARPGALRSLSQFETALRVALGNEETRANQIVQEVFGVGQSEAQQYLYNFEFPSRRLGHGILDFASHLESHMEVPQWVWQYARDGVTPESLRPFVEKQP